MAKEKMDIFEDENYLQGLDPLTLRRTEQEVKKSRRNKMFTKKGVIKFVVWILVLGILGGLSFYPAYTYLYQPYYAKNFYNSLKFFYGDAAEGSVPSNIPEKFGKLFEMNSDVGGWLTVENFGFPVAMSKNKEAGYYRNHLFNNKSNPVGSPYFDDCYNANKYNNNTIIHLKPFFGEGLAPYSTDINFYKKNPLIALDTLEKDRVYKIFAIVTVNEGYAGEYIENNFDSDYEYSQYLNKIYEKSILTTSVGVSTSRSLLTVIAESGAEYSTIIFAREMFEGESPMVDVSGAYLTTAGSVVSPTDVTATDVTPTDVTKTDIKENAEEDEDVSSQVEE